MLNTILMFILGYFILYGLLRIPYIILHYIPVYIIKEEKVPVNGLDLWPGQQKARPSVTGCETTGPGCKRGLVYTTNL